MITLHVLRQPAITRHQFSFYPAFSVALDGFVGAEPYLDEGPRRNFNHHEGVDRSCTLSTCEQVRRAVLLGFYDMFPQEQTTLYVNDCDQDVSLASWILMHPDKAADPLVRQLSQVNDLLDSSGGTFPLPQESSLLRQVAWVFEPYTSIRGRLNVMNADNHKSVINSVHCRIDDFVGGRAKQLRNTGVCQLWCHGNGWRMVEIITPGHSIRSDLSSQGIKAAVEFGPKYDGRRTYSVWRRSEYVSWFPVRKILDALTTAEAEAEVDLDVPGVWGGSDNIGGSPRPGGSVLSPPEVQLIVDRVLT